eukprot:COSAG01_NODE_231_length_21019_cov_104.980501_4_plen_72_part_00
MGCELHIQTLSPNDDARGVDGVGVVVAGRHHGIVVAGRHHPSGVAAGQPVTAAGADAMWDSDDDTSDDDDL